MNDRDNPDEYLRLQVAYLLRLWDDIRFVYRSLPKQKIVGPMSLKWVTHPPTRNIIPSLLAHAAMQPISPQERVLIMHAITAWADGYNQLVALSALPREARDSERYVAATRAVSECADLLRQAVTSIRRDMRRKRRRHGLRPVD